MKSLLSTSFSFCAVLSMGQAQDDIIMATTTTTIPTPSQDPPTLPPQEHFEQQQQHQQQPRSKVRDEEFDERTFLDTFGETAKQYLTQKVIPPTDPDCQWDWRTVRCEPYCKCGFLPQRGDYHLGRSCRRLTPEQQEDCDPLLAYSTSPEANALQIIIQRMVRGSRHVVDSAEHAVQSGYQRIQSKVCADMEPVQCTLTGELPAIAWQERLFCPHKIPECENSQQFSPWPRFSRPAENDKWEQDGMASEVMMARL